MALYARSELKVLLGLAGAVLVGLTAREWRAGFPEHADHLEHFDREPAAPLPPTAGAEPARASARRRRRGALQRPSPVRLPDPGRRQSSRLPPRGLDDPRPLDLNLASVAELARLPGVGPALAGRIVADRERAGPFASADALRRVLGVGPRKLAAIRALVTAGDDPRPDRSGRGSPHRLSRRGATGWTKQTSVPETTPAEAPSDAVGP